MADLSRPLASAGEAGTAILRPGTFMNHASGLCECCAAAEPGAPLVTRMVSGTLALPPLIKRALATWLTIWSPAHIRKSPNMISTMGRMPIMAAPRPAPMMAISLMGVSRTRSSPNSSSIPAETPHTPPKVPTSSPIRNTAGSRRISSTIASRIASE